MEVRDELLALVQASKALAEWHLECGSDGLPRASAEQASDTSRSLTDAPRERAIPAVGRAPELLPVQSAAPTLSADARRARLAVLNDAVKACTRCELAKTRTNTVFARGNPDAELCFIGEGPGADEDAQGLPFVGKAGELLDRMIAAMGYARDDVYICNIVKCRPPGNRNPEPAEVSACQPYLTDQIETIQPKAIVTLGNVPLKALFNAEGITKLRGTWRLYRGLIPTMPTYHPAYVLRNPTEKVRGDVWSDLKQVLLQIGRPIPKRKA